MARIAVLGIGDFLMGEASGAARAGGAPRAQVPRPAVAPWRETRQR